jgi:hypothetical protein
LLSVDYEWSKRIKPDFMHTISSLIIYSFKIGDNINYNLEVLKNLYTARETATADNKKYFNKPIVTTSTSIIEACLYDFHKRATNNTSEVVRNLASSVVQYMKGKQIDQFESLIASSRKHKLFGRNDNFYKVLDELRKARNRIHIQNTRRYSPKDEERLFTDELVTKSERALERTMKVLNIHHSRDKSYDKHVKPFQIPWDPHFSEDELLDKPAN